MTPTTAFPSVRALNGPGCLQELVRLYVVKHDLDTLNCSKRSDRKPENANTFMVFCSRSPSRIWGAAALSLLPFARQHEKPNPVNPKLEPQKCRGGRGEHALNSLGARQRGFLLSRSGDKLRGAGKLSTTPRRVREKQKPDPRGRPRPTAAPAAVTWVYEKKRHLRFTFRPAFFLLIKCYIFQSTLSQWGATTNIIHFLGHIFQLNFCIQNA